MIYPICLYNFGKVCQDSLLAGDVLRALCKQDIELTPEGRIIFEMIKNDNGWMDERIEAKREKDRKRQAERRAASTMSRGVTPCPRDNAVSHDVADVTLCHCDNAVSRTLPTYLPSSLPTSLPSISRTDADTDRGFKGDSGSASVRLNVFKMSGEEFFGNIHPTLELYNSALGKGFWAKAIRQLGEGECLEELWAFVSEVRAGESVDNPGAVMTKRLKAKGVK